MKLDPERPRLLLIERARKASECDTDADLARLMRVTPQTLSQWKSGQVAMTDERVIQMAEIAGDAPELWLLMMSYANAKSQKTRRIWGAAALRLAAQLDGMAKLFALVILVALPWSNPAAAYTPRADVSHAERLTGVCIMRSARRLAAALIALVVGSRRGRAATALLA